MTKRKKKKLTYKTTSYIFVAAILAFPLALFFIFWVGGNFYSILYAFQKVNYKGEVTGWAGFDNFVDFWNRMTSEGDNLWWSFYNSFRMYFISLLICMPLYIIFSYLIYKKCIFHNGFRAISMIPQIISGFVISMVFAFFVSPSGAWSKIGPLLGMDGSSSPLFTMENDTAFFTCILYSVWLSFGTNLIVYPNAMNGISPEIIDSSRIDGVSTMWQDLRYIILPLIFPTIETFLITGLAGIFTNAGPLVEFYYTSAPTEVYNMGYFYTVPLINDSANPSIYPMLSAGGLMMTAIVAPLTILLRYLLERFGPNTGDEKVR